MGGGRDHIPKTKRAHNIRTILSAKVASWELVYGLPLNDCCCSVSTRIANWRHFCRSSFKIIRHAPENLTAMQHPASEELGKRASESSVCKRDTGQPWTFPSTAFSSSCHFAFPLCFNYLCCWFKSFSLTSTPGTFASFATQQASVALHCSCSTLLSSIKLEVPVSTR